MATVSRHADRWLCGALMALLALLASVHPALSNHAASAEPSTPAGSTLPTQAPTRDADAHDDPTPRGVEPASSASSATSVEYRAASRIDTAGAAPVISTSQAPQTVRPSLPKQGTTGPSHEAAPSQHETSTLKEETPSPKDSQVSNASSSTPPPSSAVHRTPTKPDPRALSLDQPASTAAPRPRVESSTGGGFRGELSQYDASPASGVEGEHACARACVAGAAPMTCRYRFVLENYHAVSKACYACRSNASDCSRPDCVAVDGVSRPLVVVNRRLPGPSVEVCAGDRIVVDLVNHLLDASTSIHWHGHHQRGTPFMDGVPHVTQCPVPPRTAFRYRYTADTVGTHFWHSHSGCQRADGAFGALIVRAPAQSDPSSAHYDRDLRAHTMQVLDWTHAPGADKFTAHHHAAGDNKPDTLLVNGRGRWKHLPVDTRRLASFTVEQGLRYRFRLINAGFLNCPVQLSIDNHTMLVIASDGSPLRPVEADSLVSYAGERFDFVVSATAAVGAYWIRLRGLMDCDERFNSAHQLAVLRYEGSAHAQVPAGATDYEAGRRKGLTVNALNVEAGAADSMVMTDMDAVDADDATSRLDADLTFYLAYDFHPLDNPTFHRKPHYAFYQVPDKRQRLFTPQFNHVTMRLPPSPPLSQPGDLDPGSVCSDAQLSAANASAPFTACTHLLRAPLGAVVELVLVDEGVTFDANHPFHLHGTAFRVVATDRLGTNTTLDAVRALDAAGLIARKLRNAPRKDTVTVPDGGYTIVRFVADNPGFWLFHCHIEFHVEVGMSVLFQVGEPGDVPTVPAGFPRCGDYLPADDADDEADAEVEVVTLAASPRARLRDAAHAAGGTAAAAAPAAASATRGSVGLAAITLLLVLAHA